MEQLYLYEISYSNLDILFNSSYDNYQVAFLKWYKTKRKVDFKWLEECEKDIEEVMIATTYFYIEMKKITNKHRKECDRTMIPYLEQISKYFNINFVEEFNHE